MDGSCGRLIIMVCLPILSWGKEREVESMVPAARLLLVTTPRGDHPVLYRRDSVPKKPPPARVADPLVPAEPSAPVVVAGR
jgi:hypothetical protein